MDIYCRHCGEPWEIETLHDFDDYKKRAKLFARLGCNALYDDGDNPKPCTREVVDPDAAQGSAVLQELSEHPDDWLWDRAAWSSNQWSY